MVDGDEESCPESDLVIEAGRNKINTTTIYLRNTIKNLDRVKNNNNNNNLELYKATLL